MSFGLRLIAGCLGGAVGGLIAGPAGMYAGWKLGGFATTGNPLHLIPGGGIAAGAMSAVADFSSIVDLGMVGDPPTDIQGHTLANDVHGGDMRADIHQNPPHDIWGRPT